MSAERKYRARLTSGDSVWLLPDDDPTALVDPLEHAEVNVLIAGPDWAGWIVAKNGGGDRLLVRCRDVVSVEVVA